jgi:hypothetical protein
VTPLPGGGTVGEPGTAPQPTLEGIAVEVGKLEQKMERMLSKPPGFDFSLLEELLEALRNWLAGLYPGGSYTLTPVCGDGDPIEIEWSGGSGSFNQLNAKLDALAGLLQAHKIKRQPICHVKAVGSPVTVNFREV